MPSCGYGSFHQQYWLDGQLVAVGVVDVLPRWALWGGRGGGVDPQLLRLTTAVLAHDEVTDVGR
jgi:hypothetical protein